MMVFELVKICLDKNHPWINQTLDTIITPIDMLVVTIIRDNQMILPKGSTRIMYQDILIMYAPSYEGNDIYLDEICIEQSHH